MIVFIIIAIGFSLPLALYAPDPESLREVRKIDLQSRIRSCAGTLTLGLVLILAAAFLFDENYAIDSDVIALFALSRQGIFENGLVFQFLTANLLHINLFHLVANLSALALLSAYERRVGWHRFAVVFLVAAVISSIADLLWLDPQTASMGASGGLCGLAAAYFMDYPDLTISHWVQGLLLVLFIVGVYSYFGAGVKGVVVEYIDPVAHIVGASAAAAYVYLVQPRPVPAGRH